MVKRNIFCLCPSDWVLCSLELAKRLAPIGSNLHKLADCNLWNKYGYILHNEQFKVGYHRLWSHRSYGARLPLRIALAIMGTAGFQGSIRFL